MNVLLEKPKFTFDEYIQLSDAKGFELEDGYLVEKKMGALSAEVASTLIMFMGPEVRSKQLGRLFISEMVYRCFPEHPGTGRKPDVSFVSTERLPGDWQQLGYFSIAPDLAVEVISPNDLAVEVDQKIFEYLEAGVRLVWEVNPELRFVYVHRLDGSVSKLQENDLLQGEDVVKGFSCRVGDLFPPRAA